MDTDREEMERRRKENLAFPTVGGESTNPENMEALYASVRSWGMEEQDNTPFPYWKGVDEYQDPVDPTYLSSKFAAVFTEVASLLHSCVERSVILNDITQDNSEVLGDKSN